MGAQLGAATSHCPADEIRAFRHMAPTVEFLDEALGPATGRPLPDGWHVAVADVVDSTGAVAGGRYKAVNLAGASAIVAISNLASPASPPFVFGGDGATICVPQSLADDAAEALGRVRRRVRETLGLELRTGMVPVARLRREGADVRVAWWPLSDHVEQALFTGGGLTLAERLVKREAAVEVGERPGAPDLSGLECRWRTVPAPRGEVVALLATAADPAVYAALLERIDAIYGDPDACHPVGLDGLGLSLARRDLRYETAMRARGRGVGRAVYLGWLRLQLLAGRALMATGVKVAGIDWGAYRPALVRHTDCRKLDDTLRLVISGTAAQRERLESWLEVEHAAGRIVWGLHASDAAMLTCLVQDYQDRHVHFVDGADGGYAMAAAELKRRAGEAEKTR